MTLEREIQGYNENLKELTEILQQRNSNIKNRMNTRKFKARIKFLISGIQERKNYFKSLSGENEIIIETKERTFKDGKIFYNC
jgi:hypothetical protein